MESPLHRNPPAAFPVALTVKRPVITALWEKILLSAFFFLLLSSAARAQNAANYIFTASSGTYTDLVGGTAVTAVQVDDGISGTVPIGFNFVFCGTPYANVITSSNGWMSFGTPTGSVLTNDLTNLASITPAVMPLWDDLGGQSGVSSAASYATTGTPPNRVFTFEWKNWRWRFGSGAAISFQVKLYETSNIIQYVYRQEAAALATPTASIGIAKTNADYLSLDGTTASPVASSTNFTTGISAKPATNQIYQFSPPPPCSGKPTAGTVNNLTPCPNKDFPLSLTGTSIVTSLAYQWQSTTTPAVLSSWSAAGILNATQAVATGNIAVPTWFRCIVTCTLTGQSDTTVASQFNLSSFLYCYCIPTYSSGGGSDNINSVTLRNLSNNTSAAGNPSPYYHDYTSQQPTPLAIPVLTQGRTDTVTITFGSDANQYNGVWIDFDRSGTFETTEFFTSGTNAGGNGTAKVVFTTPTGGPIGITRMRIRGGDDSQPFNSQPCGASNSSWGEAEDYFVEIQYPPCNGPVDAGIAYISDTASCTGYDVMLTDTSHEHFRSGIVWNWQASTTAGSIWNNVANSTGKDTIIQTIAGNTSCRLRMICNNTGDTTYSNIVAVHIKPPYKCYCFSMATGKDKDSTDVGAFGMGNFLIGTPGGPHLRNPDAIQGRTDYTDMGPVQLFADSTYETDVFQIMRYDVHGDAKITLFIDFNNNLQYDIPQERLVTGFTSINDWYKLFYVTIPANVITDVPTGMRLIINSNTSPNVPSDEACGPYTSGETEDYVVVFKHNPNVGITGVSNITALQLYPNPSDGKVTISMNTAKPVKEAVVVITDITGRSVYTATNAVSGTSFSKEIDLSGQARGMYLITITADGEKLTRKLTLR